jgi:large subunit ribosomal protein L30e
MDMGREIRRAVDTGKVSFGEKQAEKSVLKGAAELIVISDNAKQQAKEKIEQLCSVNNVPVYEFQGNGLALGSVCGKPFVISMLSIETAGKSKIMDSVKKTR